MGYTTGAMTADSLEVAPGPDARTVITADGQVWTVPPGWVLVPPGDPALTRRIKKAGPSYTVKEKRGRKVFSRGVWAPQQAVESISAALTLERADPAHQRKLEAGRARRAREQEAYADEFEGAVLSFLDFAPSHASLGRAVARAIAQHAIPVGSGTVARTQRISVERRAEAATIAWLRHQTTVYDDMRVPRVKGMRREVRRLLAERSRRLLGRYRRGEPVEPGCCPLRAALSPDK